MICCAHQLNFLPGVSVVEKIRRSDAVIWIDRSQFSRYSFVSRNRLSDGAWMTVPVRAVDVFAPLDEVRIADPEGRKREKIARHLEQSLGASAEPFAFELRRRYELLAGLNHALIVRLFDALDIRVEHHFQSMLDPLHAVPAWSDDDDELVPVRERFASMLVQIGGTTWLSGSGGRNYLNEEPFAERGIHVQYLDHVGPNPSAVELLRGRVAA